MKIIKKIIKTQLTSLRDRHRRAKRTIRTRPPAFVLLRRDGVYALALLCSFALTVSAAPGSTTANFLKIGVGARGAAMGEAQAAVTEDVNSSYWNPAGLSAMRFKEISLMHYQLVEGVNYQHLGFGLPTEKRGNFGFGVNRLDYGDINGFDDASLPTGSVDASSLLLNVAWGKKVFDKSDFALGANFKYLRSDLAGYSASAPIFDFGALYPFRTQKLRDLYLAFALRNLGPNVKFDSQGSDLPQQLVFGSGLKALGGNLVLALDVIKPKDNGSYVAAGIEYRVFQLLNLRAGYNSNSNFVGNSFTYGLGIQFDNWNLDYAFVPFGDLGDTNRLSVGVRFGRAQRLRSAEEQVELAYRKARRELASGRGVDAYATVIDLLLIAPWHQPSVELKAKIEKQFSEMQSAKNKVEMEAQIADAFTKAKAAFDRDELVEAKQGFTNILALQPDHVGAKVYLDRIKSRYESLAEENFKLGMDYFAAGDYEKAATMFEKTLTINEYHRDARAQLEKTRELIADRTKRIEEIKKLAGAADSYKEGLRFYREKDWENALKKFEEVQTLVPEYEEVSRYYQLTVKTWSGVLFEEAKVHIENGQLKEAVQKLEKAKALAPDRDDVKTALDVARRDLAIQNARRSKQLYQDGLESYLSGRTDRAEELWKQALELDPSNDDALKAISKLEEQKAYENKER